MLYCILFMATIFVNKYVLSVLKFQYPTIFQGWQTLVGFVVISLLVTSRHLPRLMENTTRVDLAMWLPGMLFFVCSIYSGSRALAKMSIPVYLSLHNIVTVILCTCQLALYKQLTSLYSYIMLMTLVISAVFTGVFDPDFSSESYVWMCVHVLSSGAYGIYSKVMKGRLKLSLHDKIYCNYLYSVIVLVPCSYLLGDTVEVKKYPYLYFSKFYIGCIMSGVFGTFLSLSNIRLVDIKTDKEQLANIHGIAKLLTALVSLLFFDVTLTTTNVLWITVNLVAAIVCQDSSDMEGAPVIPISSGHHPLRKQNQLTNEYIRVPIS